jgi:hypothetical protein
MYGGLSKKLRGLATPFREPSPVKARCPWAEGKYSEKPGEPIRNVSGNISFQIAGDLVLAAGWLSR